MHSSRIRSNNVHIFECFLEVVAPQEVVSKAKEPWILQSYPPHVKEKEASKLKSVPHFVFPCPQLKISTVQNFSFVLTGLDAHWTFGFCRVAPNAETGLVILSHQPWHEIFYKLLNRAAEIIHQPGDDGELWRFLEATHSAKIPHFGGLFHVSWLSSADGTSNSDFSCIIPDQFSLPSIPENRNLTEYYNACGIDSMLGIFASMLHERRIIVTSQKLSRLSGCVQAANALIYPMNWQHIFIPVFPNHLGVEYLYAPMPYLIGVPAPIMTRVKLHELGDVVLVDADCNCIKSPFDDVQALPSEVKAHILRNLKNEHGGDAISRAFLRAVVHLIGGYRDALKFRQGESIVFDDEAFITSRPSSLAVYLREMLNLQIFRQFVEDRVDMLNKGKSLSDEFEKEVVRFSEQSTAPSSLTAQKIRSQYAQVKKEGGALVKAVKSKANPAVKTAVKSVREGSRQAYKGMKTKIRDNQPLRVITGSSGSYSQRCESPSSLSNGSDQLAASPSHMGSRRAVSVMNVHSPNEDIVEAQRPLHSAITTMGLSRYDSDFGFVGKVLKYERFDPPTVESIARRDVKSPDFGVLPKLDLDLMTDLRDVIFKQPQVPPSRPQQPPPPVNRELKPVKANPDADDLVHFSPPPIQQLMSDQVLQAGQGVDKDDLIRLSESQRPIVVEELNMFDPLMTPTSQLSGHRNADAHKPLARSTGPATLLAKPLCSPEAVPVTGWPRPGRVNYENFHALAARDSKDNVRMAFTQSSEDLLQEYGLDFSKLSLVANSSSASHATMTRDSCLPTHSKGSDIFVDLDPLNSKEAAGVPPVAPPRLRRSDTSAPPPSVWTTFE